ncbi:MAG: hypothetical protein JWO94_1473 [Verrucomicrobiaceae bacterium]|nr:hypothetical protein [Verrucomicrobiaceae bacterium]
MNTISSLQVPVPQKSAAESTNPHHADQRDTSLESPAEMVSPATQEEAAAELAISETNPSSQD